MFYRVFRALIALALRLFFRIEAPRDPAHALRLSGPVMYLGNHPNGLIDPGVIFILSQREVTFLAKEPLFRLPVLGFILKAMKALPVFRKQDGKGDTTQNEGTLSAAVEALLQGRAITLFPEGKSHSEPQLAELRTGAARIALQAARRGAPVKLVPIGMTYEAKQLFRSRIHVEIATPLSATEFLETPSEESHLAARRLTEALSASLREVTLNLEAWEDYPLLETAEALYAMFHRSAPGNIEHRKAFAKGLSAFRREQPARFEQLKHELTALRSRLKLQSLSVDDLTSRYRPTTVALFMVRNLLWLLMIPVVGFGVALFAIPYFLPRLAVKVAKPDIDTESTVKFFAAVVLGPLWWALLTGLGWWFWGGAGALSVFVVVPALALFTRYFLERRSIALRDARVFLVLTHQRRSHAELLAKAQALATAIEDVVAEFT